MTMQVKSEGIVLYEFKGETKQECTNLFLDYINENLEGECPAQFELDIEWIQEKKKEFKWADMGL